VALRKRGRAASPGRGFDGMSVTAVPAGYMLLVSRRPMEVPKVPGLVARFVVVWLAAVLAVAGFLPLPALAGGAKHVVQALNSDPSVALARSGVVVVPVASDPAAPENLAYAKGSDCTGCRTVAVAFQSAFVTRDAREIRPTNTAIAVNERCDRCATFASAYQYVATTRGPVYLSAQGQRDVAEIRGQAAALAASDLDFAVLRAELGELAERFRQVMDEELRRAGELGKGELTEQVRATAS
jgi:hypothetical protein